MFHLCLSIRVIAAQIEKDVLSDRNLTTFQNVMYSQRMLERSTNCYQNMNTLLDIAKKNDLLDTNFKQLVSIPSEIVNDINKYLGKRENKAFSFKGNEMYEYAKLRCVDTNEFAVIVNASQFRIPQDSKLTPKVALAKLRFNFDLNEVFELEGEAVYYINKEKNVYVTHYSFGLSRFSEFENWLLIDSK